MSPDKYNKKQIIGFAGRDLKPDQGQDAKFFRPKWKLIGDKSKWRFPLIVNHDLIRRSRQAILVESIGDMLNLHEKEYDNCLIIFGLDISPSLICSLTSLSIKSIVIATNNDSEKDHNRGLNSAIKNYLKLSSYFDYDKLSICLPIKNDFGDMDDSDFEKWEEKKDNLNKEKQRNNVVKEAFNMLRKGALPKSFSSKVNKLKKIIT